MYPHFTIPNFLTSIECNSILSKCKNELNLERATIADYKVNFKSRKSSVAWIRDLGFLNKKLQDTLTSHIKVKGFDVSGLQDFQFTEYTIGEYYNWHKDSDINDPLLSDRFYSTVIQLNDGYGDGELQLNIDNNEITLEPGVGTLYMFPSHIIHRVKPITSGVRYSLVNWIKLVENKNEPKTLF